MKNNYLKVIPWLLRFCVILQLQFAYSQNVTKAEYFYDTEPGIGMGTPIAGFVADDSLGFTFTANVWGLEAGYHNLHIRVMDSLNVWGVISTQFFLLNPLESPHIPDTLVFRLAKAEYFFDTDPGVGNGVPMLMFAADTLNQSYTFDASALAVGSHIVGVRVKDIRGNWSVIGSSTFIVSSPTCTPPHAFFTADLVNAGSQTHFTNQSTNTVFGTSYLWTVTDQSNTFTDVTLNYAHTFANPGYYDVLLKVKNVDTNCISYWREKVFVGPALSRNITVSGNTTFCDGDSVLLTGPIGTNFQWSTGALTQSIYAKTAGSYQVSYFDAYNIGVVSNIVNVTVNPVLSLSVDVSPANNGLSNGSAMANVSGGSNYLYSYNWSTGQHTQMAAGLAGGNYSIMVTDGICPVTKNYIVPNIIAPPSGIVKAQFYVDTIPNDTAVWFASHNIVISFGDTINSFCNIPLTGVTAGYHYMYVRVLDASGLFSTWERFLFHVDTTITPPIDYGYHLAKAEYFFDDTDPGVGNGLPLTVMMNFQDIMDQDYAIDVSSLPYGFHNINIRVYDNRYGWGVITPALFYLQANPDLFPEQPSVTFRLTEAEYFYDSDPGIGYGKPLFVIPNDSINMNFTADLTGLAVGTHKIYIRVKDLVDKWSVVSYGSFNVISPAACTVPTPEFNYTLSLAGQPSLFNSTSSNTNVATTYEWDVNNDNLPEYFTANCAHTFAVAGIYPVKLTVNNGGNCIATITHYVSVGAQLSNLIMIDGSTAFCAGSHTTLTAPAGSNYQWSTGETTHSIMVSTSGYYQVAYTDLNNIPRISNMVIITVYPQMTVSVDVDDASNGMANGSAATYVSGGSSWAYHYLYSTGETMQTVSSLAAGSYNVWVSDDRCPVIIPFTVNNIVVTTGLMLGEYAIDGLVDTGTAHPFYFGQGDTVNTYAHIQLPPGLSIGQHNIVIRFRESTGLYTIPWLTTFFVTDSVTPQDTTTPLITMIEYFFDDVDPSPGNGYPITVPFPSSVIDHTFNAPLPLGLTNGIHTILTRVKDDRNNWSIVESHIFYVGPDSIQNIQNNESPLILAEYYIDTDPGPGNGTSVSITPGFTIDENFSVNASSLSVGNHYICVRVKDLNNVWSVVGSKLLQIVPQNGCITPTPDFTFNPANAGDVVNFVNTSSNTNPTTMYEWYISSNTVPDDNSMNTHHVYAAPGTYDVRLMVSNGSNCQSTIIKQINIGPILSNTITVVGNLVFCDGGSVSLIAPAGSNYVWPNGANTQSILVTSSGMYQVVYTDIYGVVRVSDAVQVIVHPVMNIVTSVGFANNGLSNGSAGVVVSGGNSYAYTYHWSTGATAASISGVPAGAYQVNVSDGVCPESRILVIPDSSAISPTEIIVAQYFFDTDPGIDVATKVLVSQGDSINSFIDVSTVGLTVGVHNLLIRVQDNTGKWSVVSSQQVFILPPEAIQTADTFPYIVAAEYFYNTDPGIGNGVVIPIPTPASVIDLTCDISTIGANYGSNLLAIRVKDNLNKWSVINTNTYMMCNPPSNPVAANDTIVCQGSLLILRASNVPGASYSWFGPNNYTSSVQNPQITADTNKSGYYKVFTVTGGNCYSHADSLKLEVKIIPFKPGYITGHTETCMSDTVVFFVPLVQGAISYDWDFPVAHTILAGYNTNTIGVRFDGTLPDSIPIRVRGHSDCGYGVYSDTFKLIINSQIPDLAGIISGSSSVCQQADSVQYSVPAISHASFYEWSLPPGATIIAGYGTRIIRVRFSTSAVSGNLQVYGRNSCGNGIASANFHVTVNAFPVVSQSSYQDVCGNASSVLLTGGLPSGGTYSGTGVLNGLFNPSIAGAGTHNITYTYSNGVGCSDTVISTITVIPVISQTGVISGAAIVCQNSSNIYSVAPIPNATSYVWTLPSGFTGLSTSNTIVVGISAIAGSGQIKVKGNSACGNGPEASYNVTVNPIPAVMQLAIAQYRCGSGPVSFTATSSAGSGIQWSIDNFTNIAGFGNVFILPNIAVGNTVTVYYRASNLLNGCESAVHITTGTASPTPVILSVSGDTVCSSNVALLSAVASAGTISWHNQLTGGVIVGLGLNYSPLINTTTAYYVDASLNECTSSPRIMVIAFANPSPSAPGGNTTQSFGAGATVADLVASGSSIIWYDAAVGGNVLLSTELLIDGNTYYASQTSGGCESQSRLGVTVSVAYFRTINLHLFLEGLFDRSSLSMVEAMDGNVGEPQWGYGIADRVQVDLYEENAPYDPHGVSISGIDLSTHGLASFQVSPTHNGNYYIKVSSRNHLATWSGIAVPFNTNPVEYYFTTGAFQAYGSDPQIQVSSGPDLFAFYLGDLDQGGWVDADDFNLFEPELTYGSTGFYAADFNGSGWVDADDFNLFEPRLTLGNATEYPGP